MKGVYAFLYYLLWPLFRLLFPLRVEGLERIPEGAAVVCANHSSAVDPILLAYAVGKKNQLHFMAKIELRSIFFIGWLLEKAGIFFVDRSSASDINAIRAAMKYLKNGEKVMMFPEGTRVSDDDAIAAKTGATRLASRLNVPIVPVYLSRKKRLFHAVDVHIGEAFFVARTKSHEEAETASDELMGRIYALRGAQA